jgi:hypothetical protein
MKIYNERIIKNIIFAEYLLVGTFGGAEIPYGNP